MNSRTPRSTEMDSTNTVYYTASQPYSAHSGPKYYQHKILESPTTPSSIFVDDDITWTRNPNEEDNQLPNELSNNLNTLEDTGIHSPVLMDSRHAVARQYTQ